MTFEFDAESNAYARLKVVGVGGAGGNAINRMIDAKLAGVEFIAINTDLQTLEANKAPIKLQIGKSLTKGQGAGTNPEIGRKAVEEDRDRIVELLQGAEMVFVTCGMGGGTGTGASPIIAEIACQLGALTVAIVTKPFEFEGPVRVAHAESGIEALKKAADSIITIPNQRLIEIMDKTTLLDDSFAMANDILLQATKGISDLITIPGLKNLDFADVKNVMSEKGEALMGTGCGSGENRAIDATARAISSPILNNNCISGARKVLVNITGGHDITLFDVNEATQTIRHAAGNNANVNFGIVIDPNMKDELRVTVIATGFGDPQPPTEESDYFETSDLFGDDYPVIENPTMKNKVPKVGKFIQNHDTGKSETVKEDFGVPAYIRRKLN
ncbi:MAG: cell division protein FtsZ [candidate division Zixibacteria bacterium CG_4_9_14_3_um_filter_46_8]|nr:MAG: cell division protein FtsZ [candidate division Zixibacteria bacterium CG_4_9_14_3_um_filter_46_8]